MSIFGSIWHKITGSTEEAAPSTTTAEAPTTGEPTASPAAAATTEPAPSPATPTDFSPEPTETVTSPPAAAPISEVNVEKILTDVATQKGEPSHWRTSIVDFLKLLDIDPSLASRTELAEELNVHAGAHGSAEQNTALHRAVMQKLEENGGKVPDSLKG